MSSDILARERPTPIAFGMIGGGFGPLPPLPDADDGVAGMAFIEAVVQSAASDGRWVTIKGLKDG